MKLRRGAIALPAVLGALFLIYPPIAARFNAARAERLIEGYSAAVCELEDEEQRKMHEEAELFNLRHVCNFADTEGFEYEKLLNVGAGGIMGYIEIPSLYVRLPIYHGTSDEVLEKGAGHLENTSLPVGGTSTHTVVSAHRGLPGARLFTDLDRLEEGDTFLLNVLGEKLTYRVCEINIALPQELDELAIIEGRDLATLTTCTPYGVNSHRLLVTGERIFPVEEPKTASPGIVGGIGKTEETFILGMVGVIMFGVFLAGIEIISKRGQILILFPLAMLAAVALPVNVKAERLEVHLPEKVSGVEIRIYPIEDAMLDELAAPEMLSKTVAERRNDPPYASGITDSDGSIVFTDIAAGFYLGLQGDDGNRKAEMMPGIWQAPGVAAPKLRMRENITKKTTQVPTGDDAHLVRFVLAAATLIMTILTLIKAKLSLTDFN